MLQEEQDPAGQFSKHSDAGLSWSLQTVGTNWFFGVHFANSLSGWAVGYNGTIYSTINSGNNWNPQSSGTTNRLVAVHFPDVSTGYAVGYTGTIVKTTNGGVNWFSQSSGSVNNLWGVFFTDVNTGWAAGWNGTILHTTNGGVTFINKISTEVPQEFNLYQNYPNPFNPVTKIKFDVPASNLILNGVKDPSVRLIIYDVLGRGITTLVNEKLSSGTYEVEWDASSFSSGIYFYRLVSGDYIQVKKMVLLK